MAELTTHEIQGLALLSAAWSADLGSWLKERCSGIQYTLLYDLKSSQLHQQALTFSSWTS